MLLSLHVSESHRPYLMQIWWHNQFLRTLIERAEKAKHGYDKFERKEKKKSYYVIQPIGLTFCANKNY